MVIWVWGVGEGGVEDSHVFFFIDNLNRDTEEASMTR